MRSSIGLGFALTILLMLQIGATLGARGCGKKDIAIAQSQGPDGIPAFTVEITNEGDSPYPPSALCRALGTRQRSALWKLTQNPDLALRTQISQLAGYHDST